jgi:hypothetical protein
MPPRPISSVQAAPLLGSRKGIQGRGKEGAKEKDTGNVDKINKFMKMNKKAYKMKRK